MMGSTINRKIQYIIKDPAKKNVLFMLWEFSKESIKRKRFAKEYFSRFIYRKGSRPLTNYLSDYEIGVLQTSRILHSDASADMLTNKLKFYQFCVANNIPTPKILAYTFKSTLHDFNKVYPFLDYDVFSELVKTWIKQSTHQSLFIKPTSSKGGVGVFRLNQNDALNKRKVHEVFLAVFSKDYIIQETIIQHPVLNEINPSAINTVRIDTYKPINQNSRVMSALVRFGRTGYVVDNISRSVGFFVVLDLETHRLRSPGIQLAYIGNQVLTHHPDTHKAFDQVLVPYVNEMIELVNRATQLSGDRLIGWDVCIGINGPIIIEGNHNYHMVMQEMAYGGYRTHPDFMNVLKEENLL